MNRVPTTTFSSIICRMVCRAFSRSCCPRKRAITAVAPTFRLMIMVMSRNFGWVARPTALRATMPSWPGSRPTITWSAMLVSWVSSSSTRLGQAIRMMSFSSIFLVTPWGRGAFFRFPFSRISGPAPAGSESRVVMIVFTCAIQYPSVSAIIAEKPRCAQEILILER